MNVTTLNRKSELEQKFLEISEEFKSTTSSIAADKVEQMYNNKNHAMQLNMIAHDLHGEQY